MSVEAGIEVHSIADLGKPLVCEVVWYDHVTNAKHPCGREATFTGTGHAELEDHGDYTMLLCDRCIKLATMAIAVCQVCQVPLLKNVRPL